MPRTIRNLTLDSRSARRQIKRRREPHWVKIDKGCFLGYRRTDHAGTWIARWRDEGGRQHYQAIGPADDVRDADGVSVLTFSQAQKRAHQFFDQKAQELAGGYTSRGTYTVSDALRDHFKNRERRGDTSVDRDRVVAKSMVEPHLGDKAVAKLTRRILQDWIDKLVDAPPRARTAKNAIQNHRQAMPTDPEYLRRRRASVTRIWAITKAALNGAYKHQRVSITNAWAGYTPFTGTQAARVRWLTDDEARRLVAVCAPDFRALLTTAILTGIRYGDLGRLTVSDFHAPSRTLLIYDRKTKKTRRLPLGDEAQEFIAHLCHGKRNTDLLLTKADGSPWGPAQQADRIDAAYVAAGIAHVTFHAMRHTYASRLVMKGVPLAVVAAQLGHSSIKQVEKHYGHLCPNYVADTIRQASTPIGLLEDRRPKVVTELRRSS